VLFGITRQFVLDLCAKLNITVKLGRVPRESLATFQEAFITSTTREVMPVTSVDEHAIGDGTVGPITKRLVEAFSKLTHADGASS
jgi:branched-subunit amino acid aminotransferase/4-amino-4-deoxychorismate lyase